MAVDFTNALGTDFAGVDDIDANLTLVDGRTMLGQAIARRITTPRGGLFYDENYGIDVREFLKTSGFSPTQQARIIEGEALKDERVLDIGVDIQLNESTEVLTIDIQLTDDGGPFSLTINVDALTVELLQENT